ncbi:MAG: hypothetical protein K0Q76_1213 [Panacagrimonas sp.]|jgi:hypothetical protein|nr:hypothetical protein [Panacagrimonas sp.]MCC2656105.1 hypothetical protein [Panacagrimonas sp.]
MNRFASKYASCWTALSLVCLSAQAQDVSIVPAAATVAIDCHHMVVPDKSVLSVEVARDASKGLYVYRYTLRTSDPASAGVQAVLFEDLADSRSSSNFEGARPCVIENGSAACPGGSANLAGGVARGLTLESRAAPGVVRYSLIGEVRSGLSDADLQRLADQFGGDRDRMQTSVDQVLSSSCPYGQAKDAFEQGMTGTIVGPSDVKMLETAFTGPAPADTTDREVELRTDALRQDSITVTDSRLSPLQVGPSALERKADGTPVVRFTLDPTSARCNARGVLVRAQMQDGTAVAGSLDIEPPACPSQVDQALLVVPSG